MKELIQSSLKASVGMGCVSLAETLALRQSVFIAWGGPGPGVQV